MSETLPCGHPLALLVKSVESDHKYCAFCEVQSRLRDAVEMERHYKTRLQALEELATRWGMRVNMSHNSMLCDLIRELMAVLVPLE